MSKTNHYGIPLERHREFSFALQELRNYSQRPPAPKGMFETCINLVSEMDRIVQAEIEDIPALEKSLIYYPKKTPNYENSDLEHRRACLDELIAALRDAEPQGKALRLAAKLASMADMLECRKNSRGD